ncbi:MAG: phosphate ABC transporter permease subunit PstC [Rhodothermaceae bacterium]
MNKNSVTNPYAKEMTFRQSFERKAIRYFFRINSYIVALILIVMFLFILNEGLKILEHIEFSKIFAFENGEWFPTSENVRYSIIPLLTGTLLTSVPAVIISTICGVITGIYLSEFAGGRLREILKPAIEMFTGIPTVVVGFFMLALGSVLFEDLFSPENRLNAFVAALGLSFIVIPLIASLTEEALSRIPKEIRMGSYALGATKWQTLKYVTFPAAIGGISSGIIIGFCRAIGETMIVLMVSGNAASISANLLKSARTMTATIGAEMGEVSYQSEHYYALFFIGILLFSLSFILNIAAQILTKKFSKSELKQIN